MAHSLNQVLTERRTTSNKIISKQKHYNLRKGVGVMGSRRIFPPCFKIKVLDSYRNDIDCRGNQRATARKYNIHRRQIQKWLQCEKHLRSSSKAIEINTAEKAATAQILAAAVEAADRCRPGINGSGNSDGSSGCQSIVATPASSPQKEPTYEPCSPCHSVPAAPAPAAVSAVAQQQHHHNGAPAASPALNLSLARLHGDELAAAAAAQQHQPPPPPPPPSSSAAQALATQHQQHQATAAANYRFHSAAAATVAVAAQPTGYPDLKDKVVLPIQPHYQSEYPMIYQPTIYHQQPHHYFQPPTISYPIESPKLEEENYSQRRSILTLADIKLECSSPDPQIRESVATPEAERQQQQLKAERMDEDEHEFQRSATSSVSPPLSSYQSMDYQQHHLEAALPPSPQQSDRSTASPVSDDDMEDRPSMARRRSFNLAFKLKVLDAFHNDITIAGNQRATARKYNVNRRQVQKWLGQESNLRGVMELCGANNRQRLGPLQDSNTNQTPYGAQSPVDLRTTELGQVSPQQYQQYAVDSSLTPPYSAPGCSMSCCQELAPVGQTYYCYSPERTPTSLKRPYEALSPKQSMEEEQPVQETPLCLVKPKRPENNDAQEPSCRNANANANKTDGILFKPYLDNPVTRPTSEEASSSTVNNSNNNNNNNNNNVIKQEAEQPVEHGYNNLPVSFRPQQPQQPQVVQYQDYLQRSAFIRYPTGSNVHYA